MYFKTFENSKVMQKNKMIKKKILQGYMQKMSSSQYFDKKLVNPNIGQLSKHRFIGLK